MTGSTPTSTPRRSRRLSSGVVAVVCVALIAWLATSIHSDAEELVAGSQSSDSGSSAGGALPAATVRVPNAVYGLEVFAGRRPDAVKPSKDASAEDGYVVSVDARRVGTPAEGHLAGLMGSSPTQVSARSGRQTCPLATLTPFGESEVTVTGDSGCVMVGDVEDLRVVASFAGREQTLDPRRGALRTGDFAALYTAGQPRRTFAPLTSSPASARRTPPAAGGWDWSPREHLYEVARVPYLAALGWAGRGHEWAVVEGAATGPFYSRSARGSAPESISISYLDVGSSPAPRAYYRAGAATGGLTVNGAPTVRRLRAPRPDSLSSAPVQGGTTAFSVARGAALDIRAWTAVPVVREPDEKSRRVPGAPARAVLRTEMRAHIQPPVLLGTGDPS